jgi:hypothetical protein
LPTDRARRTDGRYRAARHDIVLPQKVVDALHRRAQAQGATLFMVLLTGLQVLLHRHTAQQDIRVGVPVANRHRVEAEKVIGFFVNTQVLRNVLTSRTSLLQALEATRDAALGAQSHQDLPFEQLVEALQPERSLGTAPLFQVMFNHQRRDHRALENLPGLTMQDHELGGQSAQFELTLSTIEAMCRPASTMRRSCSTLRPSRGWRGTICRCWGRWPTARRRRWATSTCSRPARRICSRSGASTHRPGRAASPCIA